MDVLPLLKSLGVPTGSVGKGVLRVVSPVDGSTLTSLPPASPDNVNRAVVRAQEAFLAWRMVPAPRRGELIRRFGDTLRAHKEPLARLVTLECGKILEEARGEVQEMIDICDFACGLSRQLYGLTMASERPGHRMAETWHPLGVVGVISAFNFPVAVWAWNFCLAVVCGNPVLWKPSDKTPLCALAAHALFLQAARQFEGAPADLSQVLIGGADTGKALAADARVALLSATGSTRMGRAVAPVVAARFGRSLLELGGNNAMVVTASADLDLAAQAILFSAAGTAGQRCTSLRRLLVHTSVAKKLLVRVGAAFGKVPVGNPLKSGTLVGPLIDGAAWDAMAAALARAGKAGGTVEHGGRVRVPGCSGGFYARPALVKMPAQHDVVHTETFAPILYAMTWRHFDDAIAMNNAVPQGLSSAIFTSDVREAETFLSATGSDCGIANVNIGTSGAEIGGAFGGEKETGGGREAGSDAWKNYMRRATNTVNHSRALPLAQGIRFTI